MRKSQLLIAMLLLIFSAKAQKTEFVIQSFDNQKPGRIEIYSGDRYLGTTDPLGYLSIQNKIEWFVNIHLLQDSVRLEYEVKDTSLEKGLMGGKVYNLIIYPKKIEEIVVQATRVNEVSAIAKTEISKQEIAVQNTGRDLPVLMQLQPSVVITSDAGNGIGYTGIRVRGSDATRTNITVNGVPINDAESQGTFWVNMPDFASSTANIQVQRGVGGSTNGAGAFGATVNLQTSSDFKPNALISSSAGSFNTRKITVAAGTGLINSHWTVDMRLSKITSDGFIDRAASDLSSYFLSAGYVSKKWSLKLLNFSGAEKTYQAWNGIPVEKLSGTQAELMDHYKRNQGFAYNTADDSANLFGSNNRTYNSFTYKNQTDNYRQSHYHAYYNYNYTAKSRLNITLYKTHGEGYFEQFRLNDKLSSYGSRPAIYGTDTIRNTDLIRQRWLDNDLLGLNANYCFENSKYNLTIGGGISDYKGNHYGQVIWAKTAADLNYETFYYDATGNKRDANIFVKTSLKLARKVYGNVDLQFRKVHHEGGGYDNDQRHVNFIGDYNFFNPKAGFTWLLQAGEQLYGSLSVGNREPSRSDFTDNKNSQIPKPEKLFDYELGWRKNSAKYAIEAGFYYMNYVNQLVLTGAVNDVGTPLRTNVPKSYRAGVELTGSVRVFKKFMVLGNVALSQNRLAEITTISPNYVTYIDSVEVHKNVPISYSPSVVSALSFVYNAPKNITLRWVHKYVSKQYLDNTGNDTRTIGAYYFSEIWINKTWKFRNGLQVEAQVQVLNLFNGIYNNNGYTFDYFTSNGSDLKRVQEVYLFPSATRNVLGGLVLRF